MANTSTRRTVSRPGVTSDGASAGFQSPYQPPSSAPDFLGDLMMLDPTAYHPVHVADYFWRVKVPGPAALQAVAEVAESKGGQQIHAINTFLRTYLHPDDFQYVMRRLLDPDDAFSEVDYMSLYREAVTVGTARPFRQLWAWPAPPSSVGDSCGANSRSGASRRHSPR